MIIYNTKKWGNSIWMIFLSLHWGENYKTLLRFLAFVFIYAGSITYFNINYFHLQFTVDPFFFSLLGLILSLFLVFRLNSSYNKWWEGRQLWGSLVNSSRTLAAYLSGVLPKDDQVNRQFFAAQIGNFAFALNGHLRNKIYMNDFDLNDKEQENTLKEMDHLPTGIAHLMFASIEKLYQNKLISDGDKINIKSELSVFLGVVGSCERIKKTPIPFSHSSFFKSFILIYILALPFGLVNTFEFFTLPASLLISYALFGVEIISEEIEEPFGYDANDLPLTNISQTLRKNVYEVLNVEKVFPDSPDTSDGSARFKILR